MMLNFRASTYIYDVPSNTASRGATCKIIYLRSVLGVIEIGNLCLEKEIKILHNNKNIYLSKILLIATKIFQDFIDNITQWVTKIHFFPYKSGGICWINLFTLRVGKKIFVSFFTYDRTFFTYFSYYFLSSPYTHVWLGQSDVHTVDSEICRESQKSRRNVTILFELVDIQTGEIEYTTLI